MPSASGARAESRALPEVAALLAGLVGPALTGPHLLPLERAAPARAAGVWLAALLLRATVVGSAALLALLLLPRTDLFQSLSSATWHRPLPLVPWDLDLRVDSLVHFAVLTPAGLLIASLGAFALTALLAAARLRSLLAQRGLGRGPHDSTLVADERILVGVPGFGPARILVSHAALAALDPAELDATLAHERGHLSRGHRPARLAGAVLGRAGRLVPGSRAAEAKLRLSLERDADEYAVRSTGDPLALASAIVKAAGARPSAVPLIALADEGHATARVDYLLAGGRLPGSRRLDRAALGLAVLLLVLTAALIGALTALVGARPAALGLALACAG